MAAEGGNLLSQLEVGERYRDGIGVLPVLAIAYAWLSVAALDTESVLGVIMGDLIKFHRDNLVSLMTADALAKGQRLAKQIAERLEGAAKPE